ncbi:hypothetical protein [Streptomyces albireticuli]|uniref:hypothetical protein n=1 Tax=Streptomyces albireticuli TaxID=1940 RepID=UPI00133170D0|nr:hypothetical protein [Streptomyces albireticuli]
MTQLSMVEQSSKAIWKRPFRDMATTEGPEAELLEYSSLVDALHKDFDIVCLEGPGNVANSARRLLEDTLEERSVLTRTVIEALMNITPENQGFTLSRSPASTSEDFQEIMTRRLEKRYDFLLEARNAL